MTILLMYLSCFTLVAYQKCDHKVEGTVFDLRTGEKLPFATILVEETQKGTVSDIDGHFEITNICQDEVELIISYIGYKTNTHHHDFHHGSPIIYLAPEDYSLQSVVVEGELLRDGKVGQTTSTIEIDKLTASSHNLGQALKQLSGVEMVSTGQNVNKPVIHGLHSNRILIINDDMRHEFQNWGTDHAPEIDPDQFQSIEVIKGAATVKYGPDALGGVILLHPKKLALHESINGFVKTSAFTNGMGGSISSQIHAGGHKISGTFGVRSMIQGDLRSPDYMLSNTGKKETSFNAGLRYHMPKMDLELRGSYFSQELGILRGSNTGNLDDLIAAMESDIPFYTEEFGYAISSPKQEVNHSSIKLKGKYYFANSWLETTYGLQLNNRFEFDVRRGANNETPSIDLTLLSQNLEIDFFHPKIIGFEGNMGLSLMMQDNNNNPGTNTIPFVPNFNTSRLGFYLIENKKIGNATVEFGTRYDWQTSSIRGRDNNNDLFFDNVDFGNLSASLGFQYSFKDKLFRSNVASAWRPPSISELYSFGRHQASIEYGFWRYEELETGIATAEVLTQSDKPVKSEVGFKWINSLSGSKENISWEMVFYLNYIKDYIYATPRGITSTVRGAFPYWIYTQDDALFVGGDVSLDIQHTSNLSSNLSISYVHARNLSGGTFVGIPPANIRYELRHKFDLGKGKLTLGLTPAYTFRQFNEPEILELPDLLEIQKNNDQERLNEMDVFDIREVPEGYFLLNTNVNYALSQWIFSVSGSNLLNNNYRSYTDRLRYFSDDLGINIQLEIKYKILSK
ncbi:MAG: carboxypeptidase-like regulatory domain-containing protein [Cyclobacteriaceae bacterium]